MTLDFISEANYADIYYHVIMLVTLLTFFHAQVLGLRDKQNLSYTKTAGLLLLGFVLIYMGFRPVYRSFIDMHTYNKLFDYYKAGGSIISLKDPIFHGLTRGAAQIMPNSVYFFLCTCAYVIPLYVVSKKWFPLYWFYTFLLFLGSFSFWAYGVNGIRNGIAGSLFLLGISRDKRIFQILILMVAVGFHKSILLPTAAFIIVQLYNEPKAFLTFWLLCIPVSLLLGTALQDLFAGFISDERADYFIDEASKQKFSGTGFRWDFLFYSSFGVLAGWYYTFRQKVRDVFYIQLFNIYLLVNGFWILVIKANFSNRFAYLSWFMMAVIIAYPWAKYFFLRKQHIKWGFLMIAYVSFTYAMHFIYYTNF